ncbi:MAG: hypothetical protein ABI700_15880 [Chloroflexota bacterium]
MLAGELIRRVTAQGIIYVDDGVEKFIDFQQCYDNYVKDRLSQERWTKHKTLNNQTDADWDQYVERTKNWKEVGRRNVLTPPWADGPFIEFYTEPLLRFKFASHEKYSEVDDAIHHAEWRTFDLS